MNKMGAISDLYNGRINPPEKVNVNAEEYSKLDVRASELFEALKKQLSEVILNAGTPPTSNEAVFALSQTFDISEEEAEKVLADCNNDLRMAVKLLKLKQLENE